MDNIFLNNTGNPAYRKSQNFEVIESQEHNCLISMGLDALVPSIVISYSYPSTRSDPFEQSFPEKHASLQAGATVSIARGRVNKLFTIARAEFLRDTYKCST